MKVLVTGGGGFLGQALCRSLAARGYAVTSFNRGHYPALDAIGPEDIRIPRLLDRIADEEIGEVIDASPEAARANVYEALRKLRSQFAAALID